MPNRVIQDVQLLLWPAKMTSGSVGSGFMAESAPSTDFGWLRHFYLVLAVVWLAIGVVRLLTDGGWFGWASIALAVGFGVVSALWFRKVARGGAVKTRP
jgi:hypothetical protein